MIKFIRYFIFFISFFLSITGYAVDHIICNLTNNGIPAQSQYNQIYSNIYTCHNTYPASFPAIQLGGAVLGNSADTGVTGSCVTQKLTSGGNCQFMLNVTPSKTGTQKFRLQVSVGSLYYINLPEITTKAASAPSSSKITWPGFNSGFAIADVTNNGFGGFVADATDGSGHPVTYTFVILSGPGIIIGSQTGYFTLAGINNTTLIQITASADDAAPVAGMPFTVQISPVPIKIIAFHNNTNETIYPVIESPQTGIVPPLPESRDTWMQGLFGVTNVSTYTFTANFLHRAYVNGTSGIAPGQTTLVYMPFYSHLVPSPSGGNVPDEYVDWWKSMRIYLYDVQSSLVASQSTATPITLFSSGPTCLSGCTAPVTYFSAAGGIPETDPYQLAEYTFASVLDANPPNTPPYPTYLVQVNFNISNVDQIYLPAAMEPFGSNLVGYMGSIMNISDFRTSLTNFISQTGWPQYNNTPYPRVPGAFVALVGNSFLTSNAAITTLLTNNWNNCASITGQNPINCANVSNLFSCEPLQPPIQQIYGYTSTCTSLPSSGTDFNSYIALQYNYETVPSLQEFNPYTQLIHQTLGANGYAFSVDDAVAFISTTGNGLNISIGGPAGLPNSAQFSNSAITVISPGTPAPGSTDPYFTNFGICCPSSGQTPDCTGTAPNQFAKGSSITVQYPQSFYNNGGCQITLQDTLNRVFQFTLDSVAPLLSSNITSCNSPATNPGWCGGLVITNPSLPAPPGQKFTSVSTQIPGP